MNREPQGYLHNKLDVKVLILFILARLEAPVSAQELYEVAYQDDSLNYFMFAESLPELVDSGHVRAEADGRFSITELGRAQGAQVEDSLAVPVLRKVSDAIGAENIRLRRAQCVQSAVETDEAGGYVATLRYRDGGRTVMTLTLQAPSEALAHQMAENLRREADALFKLSMDIAAAPKRKREEQA